MALAVKSNSNARGSPRSRPDAVNFLSADVRGAVGGRLRGRSHGATQASAQSIARSALDEGHQSPLARLGHAAMSEVGRCAHHSGHDLLALALPAWGLILPPASPHAIYGYMDKDLYAGTSEDQGPASRDAD